MAVAVAVAGGYSSDSTPRMGHSIRLGYSPKVAKKKKRMKGWSSLVAYFFFFVVVCFVFCFLQASKVFTKGKQIGLIVK